MINKILVANRGEIAVRIIRACKELGIETVAVHSSIDANSLHVRYADQSVCIGPADSRKSYLNIPAIISAAELTGADAIHPGYGYLSENSRFADICGSCKIKFIGPLPQHIDMMGNKLRALETAKKSNIPIAAGSDGKIESLEHALQVSEEIGYPVMLKASAGGGGKGMRLVNSAKELEKVYSMTESEAISSFNDGSLYAEKFIKNPRHIEAQIIADESGNVIHLGERECSIQRRNQKLIEETRASNFSDKTRDLLLSSAVRLAESINYQSLGTVEFLVDDKENFYFLEMNTRVQVEHPVTEQITGIDLVKEQIKIAAGEKLSITQSDIKFNGHSIECRINAEDPKTFIPNSGKITELNIPGGPGVRVDTAIYSGYNVPAYYDSMLAKLIVHANTREDAIRKMSTALSEFYIGGLKTTVESCMEVLKSEKFITGPYTTSDLALILS